MKLDTVQKTQYIWAKIRLYWFKALVGMVAYTFTYVAFKAIPAIDDAAPIVPDMPTFNIAVLVAHAVSALPPLVIGLICFDANQRRKNISLHKKLGLAYCILIWFSAITGVALAAVSGSGILGQTGFGLLGILWFFTTLFAYRTAREGKIPQHRRWMLRSFALTLAAVTVRPLFLFGPTEPAYIAWLWIGLCSWLCWIPNIIIAETFIRITNFNGSLKKPEKYSWLARFYREDRPKGKVA